MGSPISYFNINNNQHPTEFPNLRCSSNYFYYYLKLRSGLKTIFKTYILIAVILKEQLKQKRNYNWLKFDIVIENSVEGQFSHSYRELTFRLFYI